MNYEDVMKEIVLKQLQLLQDAVEKDMLLENLINVSNGLSIAISHLSACDLYAAQRID